MLITLHDIDKINMPENLFTKKEKLTGEEIVKEFKRCRGTQFDPELVDIFLKVI